MTTDFVPGDRVQLTGPKGRLHTITLKAGGQFHTHKGILRHDDLIGKPEGSVISTGAFEYLALRPRLADYVMSMPRGAAIIYPKDAAQIVADADISAGSQVFEAGVGSGALTLWLLRALGERGSLTSFEKRAEFADIASGNVHGFYGEPPANWSVVVGDLAEELPRAFEPGSADAGVLDMLAPWECVAACAEALRPGGVLVCYVATVTQLSRVAEVLRDTGCFTEPTASESMLRTWHVEGLAVRPDHRMIGHTGFLIKARRLAPGTTLTPPKRRASKTSYSAEDVEAWTPTALGERVPSDKVLRKKARESRADAEASRGSVEDIQ